MANPLEIKTCIVRRAAKMCLISALGLVFLLPISAQVRPTAAPATRTPQPGATRPTGAAPAVRPQRPTPTPNPATGAPGATRTPARPTPTPQPGTNANTRVPANNSASNTNANANRPTPTPRPSRTPTPTPSPSPSASPTPTASPGSNTNVAGATNSNSNAAATSSASPAAQLSSSWWILGVVLIALIPLLIFLVGIMRVLSNANKKGATNNNGPALSAPPVAPTPQPKVKLIPDHSPVMEVEGGELPEAQFDIKLTFNSDAGRQMLMTAPEDMSVSFSRLEIKDEQ